MRHRDVTVTLRTSVSYRRLLFSHVTAGTIIPRYKLRQSDTRTPPLSDWPRQTDPTTDRSTPTEFDRRARIGWNPLHFSCSYHFPCASGIKRRTVRVL